ncbi:alpha/beta fold hydrolase [Nocardia thailandica]|uniref:alpha/beta fold hydrolase n=1 Tax=Nocardia thailandica TaxID=257275 RepID=UPI0003172FC4|nr:alpha/beta hydrolase [Nocardia thailandica]
MTTSSAVRTGTLAVPGATLYYEVRGSGPLIVLAGAPMGAGEFAATAEALATTHTVLTTDPRGHGASVVADPDSDSTPALRGDDLAALIAHLDQGPAVVFGSSGGAVSALALAQDHPDRVTTVVAHEPPLRELLDDAAAQRVATEDLIATYRDGADPVGAWRKFFAMAAIPITDAMLEQMFGGPDRDPAQVASERYWFAHELRATTGYVPVLDVLRAGPPRIIVGIGTDSAGQFCDRTSRALAAALGVEPVLFPGDHAGFLGDPAGFAARLREVVRG